MKRFIIPCLCLSLLQAEQVFATNFTDITYGLIGGVNGSAAYAAFVDGKGNVIPVDLGIPNGRIGEAVYASDGVSINNGLGLIVGLNGTAGYAAFITPGGEVKPLNLGIANGGFGSTSLNSSNLGIISGLNIVGGVKYNYAAFVTPDGTVSPVNSLPISNAGVYPTVAINASGTALIGGQTGSKPYAALVRLGNPTSPFPLTLTTASGSISGVAMNDAGIGLIGGNYYPAGAQPYAVFVGPGTQVSQITLPGQLGSITGVAINNSGLGLVGGYLGAGATIYAAQVVYGQSTVTELSVLSSTSGTIQHVAINEAGAGILGGSASGSAFAALVAPNSQVTILNLNATFIHSVAISELGVGFVGGGNGSAAYAAIIAPNGSVTPLNLQLPSGNVNAVSIDLLVNPESIGSNWAVFNSQLAATYALNSHMTGKHRITKEEESQHPDVAFLASADDNLPINSYDQDKSSQSPSTIWVAPFGNYVHQKGSSGNPSNNNAIGGFLVGYDYSNSDLMFGGALGYTYDYISFGSGRGHGSVQEELATFYGSYEQKHLMIDFALWGGYYQCYNKRNTAWFAISKANSQGWIFTPHVEVATPFAIGADNSVSLEPFVMMDYVNNWQGSYTEKGISGLNLVMDSHYSSVLRSEAGLRFLEECDLKLGKFICTQKLSYVNQAPFHLGPVTTSFVAAASSFPVAIGNSNVQNLGGVEISASFLPWNEKYPYISFGFQGEFGSSYQSYFGNIEIGKSF